VYSKLTLRLLIVKVPHSSLELSAASIFSTSQDRSAISLKSYSVLRTEISFMPVSSGPQKVSILLIG